MRMVYVSNLFLLLYVNAYLIILLVLIVIRVNNSVILNSAMGMVTVLFKIIFISVFVLTIILLICFAAHANQSILEFRAI